MEFELGKVFLYEGNAEQALRSLSRPLAKFDDPELFVRRELLIALAEAKVGRDISSAKHIAAVEPMGLPSVLFAELLATKGTIALAQGKLDDAERFLRQALSTPEITILQTTQVYMNLGVASLRRQRYEDALELFQHALLLAQSIDARLAIEKAVGNLGRIHYQNGDFQRAREESLRAAKVAESLGVVTDEIHWLLNAGLSEYAANEFTAANASYSKSLRLSESIGDTEQSLSAHVALASLSIQSDSDASDFHIREAKRLAQAGLDRSEDLEPLLLESLLAIKRKQSRFAEHQLVGLVGRSEAVPSFQWEAENTLAQLYDGTNRPEEAELWYRHGIATFHRQRLTLKSVELQLPFLENGSELYMGYMEHLIRAGRMGEALRLLDASRAETLAEGLRTGAARSRTRFDPRQTAARLHATVLVYCLRPERSYLWAITGTEQAFYTLPGSGAILPLVQRHNEAILNAKDLLANKEETGGELYKSLLAPAERLLPHGGGRVVLVADSALSRLNFETLLSPAGAPHYWIEDVGVTNARSLRLLAESGREPSLSKTTASHDLKMLLIGNPVYTNTEYAPLPHAAAEMVSVAQHFLPAERMVAADREASPAAYKASAPGRFRYIHFVAHATASELNPLDSAVILSSSGDATSKLYAGELLKLPLSAELVTLSSCYSAGTRHYTGEGVVGLAWAFLRAGAHSVIGALWEVSDVSTPRLMDTMYTRLLAGEEPDVALRRAKLDLLHSEGVFRKPVYWGAFQLYTGR